MYVYADVRGLRVTSTCAFSLTSSEFSRRINTHTHTPQCPRDRHGRINTADFFRHVYSAVCLERTTITLQCVRCPPLLQHTHLRLFSITQRSLHSPSLPLPSLSFYDQEHGQGYLGEADLETYMYDLIGSLPALQVTVERGKERRAWVVGCVCVCICLVPCRLTTHCTALHCAAWGGMGWQGMPEAFHSFYVFTAVRRFMFFLDSTRTGKQVRTQGKKPLHACPSSRLV